MVAPSTVTHLASAHDMCSYEEFHSKLKLQHVSLWTANKGNMSEYCFVYRVHLKSFTILIIVSNRIIIV